MLCLCTTAALLTRRELFAVTYRSLSLLAMLLVLLRSRILLTCELRFHKSFLVNNELLQCHYLP